jgi:hypothetical protein
VIEENSPIKSGLTTVIDSCRAAALGVGVVESIALTINMNVPALVSGAPEITPEGGSRVNPDGKLPELTLQV